MCALLSVSRSGFYNWLNRPASERQRSDVPLVMELRARYHRHRGKYGRQRRSPWPWGFAGPQWD
jgi:putative transposase